MDVNLVLFKKDGSQKPFSVPSSTIVLGRRHDCDLQIPLASVSRRHCQLVLNNNTVKIRDLDSRNGTFLNGERINDETNLKAGDYIKVGSLMFGIQINGEPEELAPPEQTTTREAEAEKPKEQEKAPADDLSDSFFGIDEDEDLGDLGELGEDKDDSFLKELEEL